MRILSLLFKYILHDLTLLNMIRLEVWLHSDQYIEQKRNLCKYKIPVK